MRIHQKVANDRHLRKANYAYTKEKQPRFFYSTYKCGRSKTLFFFVFCQEELREILRVQGLTKALEIPQIAIPLTLIFKSLLLDSQSSLLTMCNIYKYPVLLISL